MGNMFYEQEWTNKMYVKKKLMSEQIFLFFNSIF